MKRLRPRQGFDALEFVTSSLAQASFDGNVTCRIWFAASLKDITPHVPSYMAMLEVQDDGVLLTIVAHPDWLPRLVLYLLEIPTLMNESLRTCRAASGICGVEST